MVILIILLILALLFLPGMGYLMGQLIKWAVVVAIVMGLLTVMGAMASMTGLQ